MEHVAKVGSAGHTYIIDNDKKYFPSFQTKGADYMKLGASHVDLCQDSVLDPLVIFLPLTSILLLYISICIMCDIHQVKIKID